ncbi:MAG: tRNA (adenosine(37)-N6)-dimethylallyltransferase MiaA [Magnetococcales bacterium]|nr:tRNA (adenosine(37)-N6)-dimethylallyltransferase MiaA [Magnetococcales bacterium]
MNAFLSQQNPPTDGLIFLTGPTASGKTALALALAREFPLEIINADAMQLYIGMDIGTAKPDAHTRQQVPHHLLDVVTPDDPFSAGRYQQAAEKCIRDCQSRGRIPLFVGGTGLYLRVVEEGLAPTPPMDQAILENLRHDGERLGWPGLHARLAQCDPEGAARLTPADGQRILRALAVRLTTGHPLAWWQAQQQSPGRRVLKLALDCERQALYQRINHRFEGMMEQGLLEEAASLLRLGYHRELPAMKAVGYRQLFGYLDGTRSLTECVEEAKKASRHYAKRQWTWLRGQANLFRIVGGEQALDSSISRINHFLQDMVE